MRPGRRGVGGCVGTAVLVALGMLVLPAASRAAIPGTASAPVHWEYSQDFCGVGVDYDTGWVPSGSPVQVRVQFRLDCNYTASLDGKGVLVWPPSMQLYFQGDPRGGEFGQSIGVFFEARIKWDIDLPLGTGHFAGEAPIPFVPSIDVGCLDRSTKFTPFLLSGNPDRPAHLLCQIPPLLVFQYDLLDLLMPSISGLASAWIRIYLSINLDSYLQGKQIKVSEHDQEIDEEYGRAFVYPRASPSVTLNAQYIADLSHQMIISIQPEVELDILTFSYGFDIIDIPIPIPEITDEWIFDPAEMTFYFPDITVDDTLDFGRTQVGRPRMKRFPIQNAGFDDLKLYARTGLPFGVDPRLGDPSETPLTIPAPGMDDIVVSFDPDGEGTANGILRLETNDPDEPWVDVHLTGQATYDDVGEYTDPNDCQGNECDPGYAVTGCGCRTAGSSSGGWAAVLVLGLFAAGNRLRRRRRS